MVITEESEKPKKPQIDPVLKPGKIYKQISAVMADIGAVGKDRKNTHQGYKFRGIDDVYNELNAVLAKHKVFTVPTVLKYEREERSAKTGTGTLTFMIMTVQYEIFTEDGSSVTSIVIGEAMDAGGDKASNKAMSAAHKYTLLQVFCIPTEDPKDSENDSPEVKDTKKGKITRTTTGAGKTNPPMDKFMAGQEENKDKSLDHDFNQQVITEACKEADLDYKQLKKYLKEIQGKFKPSRKFVGDIHGNLSFMAGNPEDVKALVEKLGDTIANCKVWIAEKAS